jgi:ATP-dependent exoDNAse (exonuclease V) beta subunit
VTWGDAAAIWPEGCAVLDAGSAAVAADALWDAIMATHPELTDEAREAWTANLDLARDGEPSDALATFVEKRLCGHSTDKKTGLDYVPEGRKAASRVFLNDRVAPARTALRLALLRPEFEALLRRSAALHEFMAAFEAVYDRQTRGLGRLTFNDITDVLARQVGEIEWLASAGYRLDARYDHWLLDEFQDTSRPQWAVLSAFVDEVVQDPAGGRSFFYVGDTKQALYLWRGGDPRLFFEIRDKYNGAGEARIEERALRASYRSTREIIGFVNAVFGRIEAVRDELVLPERAVADWRRAWREHTVAGANADLAGYVRWVEVAAGDEADGDEEEFEAGPQDREILRILREAEPWRRGLSCAVLKRDNRRLGVLAALLQAAGIPVSVEGRTNPCVDNPLGAALVAGFRFVASPGDELAGVLFAGSKLGAGVGDLGGFREESLRQIAAVGFADTARAWVAGIDLGGEPFLARRGEEFAAAAAEFDAGRSAGDGVHAFLDFIVGWQTQEAESTDVVRLMTVHQAKGLTFALTIVSGLDRLMQDRTADALALGGGRPPRWGTLLPRRQLAEVDPVLAAAREAMLADDFYGTLCTAYVAMTRPRYALHVVTDRVEERSTAKKLGRLLGRLVEPGYEAGDAAWFERWALRAEVAGPVGEAENGVTLPVPTGTTPRPVAASAGGSRRAGPSGAADLGSEIHAALARIEWWDGREALDFDGRSDGARSTLEGFFAGDGARSVFAKPAARAVVWRERSFDVVIGGEWFSGTFDRVRVTLSPEGEPVAAEVLDFKTGGLGVSAGELERRHAGQLGIYRTAAARLLGLSEGRVSARIVPITARG